MVMSIASIVAFYYSLHENRIIGENARICYYLGNVKGSAVLETYYRTYYTALVCIHCRLTGLE